MMNSDPLSEAQSIIDSAFAQELIEAKYYYKPFSPVIDFSFSSITNEKTGQGLMQAVIWSSFMASFHSNAARGEIYKSYMNSVVTRFVTLFGEEEVKEILAPVPMAVIEIAKTRQTCYENIHRSPLATMEARSDWEFTELRTLVFAFLHFYAQPVRHVGVLDVLRRCKAEILDSFLYQENPTDFEYIKTVMGSIDLD